MGKVKAPDIPRPEKRKRTTEDYISAYTRHCSNELVAVQDIDGKRVVSYHEWLTPENARSVALIAKENTIEAVKEALLSEVLPFFMHGGEADEVVAKLDEIMTTKKIAI
jgi:hypothetical protein